MKGFENDILNLDDPKYDVVKTLKPLPDKHSGDHKVFLFQINVTRDCNIRCTHCYIASEVKALSNRMTVSQFLKIVQDIATHMDNSLEHTHAEIHVVGGEPTLLGSKFFDKVMPEAYKIMSKAKRSFSWEFLLISNLLSNEMMSIAPWFAKVSTSYEPETRFPKPFHERWWHRNVMTLQEAGLDVGITVCITKPVVDYGAERLCNRIYEELGIKQMHFGFYIESGDGRKHGDLVRPTFEETSRFLIETAEWYLERRHKDPKLYVNPAESMLSAIDAGKPLDDIVCPIVSGSLDIDSSGNASTCIQSGGELNPTWEGNVFEQTVTEVINTDAFKRRRLQALRPQEVCRTCDEFDACRSGCGVNFQNWIPEKDKDCPGYKGFIKHMRKQHEAGIMPRHKHYRSRMAF